MVHVAVRAHLPPQQLELPPSARRLPASVAYAEGEGEQRRPVPAAESEVYQLHSMHAQLAVLVPDLALSLLGLRRSST